MQFLLSKLKETRALTNVNIISHNEQLDWENCNSACIKTERDLIYVLQWQKYCYQDGI